MRLQTANWDAFYPGDITRWLQVLVLDRGNLNKVSNTSYDCPQATTNRLLSQAAAVQPCADRVRADLNALKDKQNKLVIVTSPWREPSDFGLQPPNGAWKVFGAFPTWWKNDEQVWRGTYSSIGPLEGPSDHFTHASNTMGGPYFGDTSGDIKDLLVRDNEGHYNLSPQPLPFDTQAQGSDAGHSVMEIAGTRYVEATPSPGFHVVVLHPDTLKGSSYYFRTDDDHGNRELNAMHNVLRQAIQKGAAPFSRHELVFITTHGDVATYSLWLDDVGPDIQALGGNLTGFLAATTAQAGGHRSYTLATRAPNAPSLASEFIAPKNHPPATATPLLGTISRTSPFYAYGVDEADPVSTASEDHPTGANQLVVTTGALQSPWPEQGDAGKTAAIKFLGKQTLDTDQPRGMYWTTPWDSSTWEKVQGDIDKVCVRRPPPECKSLPFSADDLSWAKDELQTEIDWLNSEHTYLNNLAAPFKENVLPSWARLEKIADDVANSVEVHDGTVQVQTEAIMNFALDLAESTPFVGEGIGVAHKIYSFAMEAASWEGQPVSDDFQASVAKAGEELVHRMTAAQQLLQQQIPNVIASDYAKLKTVGACGSIRAALWPDCPLDHSDWQFTQDDQNRAGASLRKTAEITSYGAMLPAKFGRFILPQSVNTTANRKFGATAEIFNCYHPFQDTPRTAQFPLPVGHFVLRDGLQFYRISTIGYITGGGVVGNLYEMHPPKAAVTDHLFGTGADDLNADQEQFFSTFTFRFDGIDNFPYRDTHPKWWNNDDCSN